VSLTSDDGAVGGSKSALALTSRCRCQTGVYDILNVELCTDSSYHLCFMQSQKGQVHEVHAPKERPQVETIGR